MKKIDKTDNQILEYALTYAYFGFPVFPVHSPTNDGGCSCGKLGCKSIGKHPITKNGFKDATTDEQQIRKWWDEWPNANIGMPMGRETGLFVLDVDAGGEDELMKHPQLPSSIQSITGSGGRHIFYFKPRHKDIINSTRFLSGLDIRGEGGYVVVPPSCHKSGNNYKWKYDANIAEYDPDECSEWLLEEIEKGKNNNHAKSNNNQIREIPVEILEQQVKFVTEQIREREIIIGNDSYDDWLRIGFALVDGLGERGRRYFHITSCVSPKYNQEESDIQYDRCLRSNKKGITIGTFFHYAKEKGIKEHSGLQGERERNKKGVVIWQPILEAEIFKKGKYIIFLNEQLLMYHEGYYQAFSDRHYLKLLEEQIEYYFKGRRFKAKEVLEIVKDRHYERNQQVNINPNLINVKNGILDIENMTLNPHTPEIISTYQINANYDKNAKCDKFMKFLNDVLVKEDDLVPDTQLIEIVRCFIGYCLYTDIPYHECLMLYGGGRNGKSVLIFVISELFKDLVSFVHFEDVGINRFATSDLVGKLINVSSEFGVNAKIDDGFVKKIIAGDVIRAERKGQDAFNFKPIAKHIVATNSLPRSRDKSLGFFSRFCIVPFHRTFLPKEEIKNIANEDLKDRCLVRNPSIEQELKREMDGIFLWAINGLKQLLREKEFPYSEQVTKIKTAFIVHCSSVEMFFNERIDDSDCTAEETLKDLYKDYIKYCMEYKTPPISNRRFSAEIKNLGHEVIAGKNNVRIVKGIFIKLCEY